MPDTTANVPRLQIDDPHGRRIVIIVATHTPPVR